MAQTQYYGTGRRKSSVARVYKSLLSWHKPNIMELVVVKVQ